MFFQLKQSSINNVSNELPVSTKVKVFIQSVLGNHVFLRHDRVNLDSDDILDIGLTSQAKKAYKKSIKIVENLARMISVKRLSFKKTKSVVSFLCERYGSIKI